MILSGDHTHFYGLRKAYGRVDSYYDGVSQSKFYVNDDRLVLERVKDLGAWQGRPVMFQFHLMSAHLLGKRIADTPSFGPSENYSRIRFLPSGAGARERAVNFYDRGVLQSDHVIGELLALLGERGYLRNAVVVITADHGEALGEHDLYTHMNGVIEPQLRVPLVIATFGDAHVAPAPKGALLSQVDIAPTLADAFGMPIPASWEGQPLRSVRAPRVVYFAEKQWRGLVRIDASGRLTKYWTDRRKALEYAYDLSADPGERHNIAATLPLGEKMRWVKALAGR